MLTLAKSLIQPTMRQLMWGVASRRWTTSTLLHNLAPTSPSIINQLLSSDISSKREIEQDITPALDRKLLQLSSKTSLHELIRQYVAESGTVLDVFLPYESQPAISRRPNLVDAADSTRNVITVAHCAQFGNAHKITLSSGFALNVDFTSKENTKETLIVTCAHTLEEIRNSPLLLSMPSTQDSKLKQRSGSFIVTGSGNSLRVFPVSRVVSALPRSDLMLLSCEVPEGALNTLPVSPYAARRGTDIEAHFVTHGKPIDDGWSPWIADTWGKWHQGKVVGYRDFGGSEAEPGTYDALSHLLFTPLPTAGSSGGPIIDKESGAVVGVMRGTLMDNRVEGLRGWGAPSETIFETNHYVVLDVQITWVGV
ncbi:hypothetical protein D9619_003318 [Psilocybe cf. subviscida]|uniref:Serine protease n=1 Tax=Psilocybe cf. subviscida TaxID=2480587 RepID=A0A8H5AYV8_9AGAR|nr:hypothetical protein D9619_003318 [Psilocybe cf. subviscida]